MMGFLIPSILDAIREYLLQYFSNELLQKSLHLLAYVDNFLVAGFIICFVLNNAFICNQTKGEYYHVAVIRCYHFVDSGHSYCVSSWNLKFVLQINRELIRGSGWQPTRVVTFLIFLVRIWKEKVRSSTNILSHPKSSIFFCV